MTEDQQLRVGEVARVTGLTVRALHHYEAAGLVRPGARTQAGQPLYGMREVARLEQVATLRRAGLGLEDIAGALASGDVRGALQTRLAEVDQELAGRVDPCRRQEARSHPGRRRAREFST